MMETPPQNTTDLAGAGVDRPANLAAHGLSARGRLLVMFTSYIPLLHVACIVWIVLALPTGPGWRVAAAAAALYLAPATAGRVVVGLFPIRQTRLAVGSPEFFRWWFLLNLQMPFNRFPLLDEALRLVPGAYSAWLRLWGSKIGRLTFWAPGTRVLDRSFLDIGDDVLFGAGVHLSPHLMVRNSRGENEVLLATVRVGRGSVIGGHSLLGPGSEIAPGESTIGRLLLRPFMKYKNGRRCAE